MNSYVMKCIDAARPVCANEAQARIIGHMMASRELPASSVTAMLLLDDTVMPATQDSHILNVEIRERFEM